MIIDCDSCTGRGHACGDCVISVLLGPPQYGEHAIDDAEVVALDVLAQAGLVPPLRHVSRPA